jgi:hypothetical protein
MIPEIPKTIAANIKHFTGRTYLLPILLRWLSQTENRSFILTAEPGVGKGMVMAWLAGDGPVPEDAESCGHLEQIHSLKGGTLVNK